MKFLIALLALFSLSAIAVETNTDAPDFTLPGLNTKVRDISLKDFKGKIVVLEWLNHGCPFVRKHYDSGNMQALQKKYIERNVIWLSIISSAPGKQGYVDTHGALKDKLNNKSAATDILLDTKGMVGRLYGAKTTPHMFIINKDGNIAYQGAIDDKADILRSSIEDAKNYVSSALEEVMNNKKVTTPTTKSYGCSIKY